VRRGALVGLMAMAAAACGTGSAPAPASQVVIHVDTDAPVPHESNDAAGSWTDPIALFDRLRVDVYRPGDVTPCSTCTNEFAVTYEQLASSQISVGIAPGPNASGWVARLRLAVQRFEAASGDLDANTTVDSYVAIPPVAGGDVLDVTVHLAADDTGLTHGSLDAPIDADPGVPASSRVGTWPSAVRSPCTNAQPGGAICVPGGAYWMGASSSHYVPGASPTWRRLVVLSPFWLDQTEVVVSAARKNGLTGAAAWSGQTAGGIVDDFCTYSDPPTMRDALPVNCVTWSGAEAYCVRLGGHLPTEAQLEYTSGGASGQPYPWGHDLPGCSDAIWGRGGYGLYVEAVPNTCRTSTNFMQPMGGPEPPMHGALDVAQLPGGDVYDLAGNIYELALDGYQTVEGSCWSPSGVLRDPACPQQSSGVNVGRGGSWTAGGTYLEAGHRGSIDPSAQSADIGFRCAWPGQ
jgi:sulfatase modifying factor 1